MNASPPGIMNERRRRRRRCERFDEADNILSLLSLLNRLPSLTLRDVMAQTDREATWTDGRKILKKTGDECDTLDQQSFCLPPLSVFWWILWGQIYSDGKKVASLNGLYIYWALGSHSISLPSSSLRRSAFFSFSHFLSSSLSGCCVSRINLDSQLVSQGVRVRKKEEKKKAFSPRVCETEWVKGKERKIYIFRVDQFYCSLLLFSLRLLQFERQVLPAAAVLPASSGPSHTLTHSSLVCILTGTGGDNLWVCMRITYHRLLL